MVGFVANRTYLGNDKLRKANVKVNYTLDQIKEFEKCANDPAYFIKNYVYIVTLGKGRILFDLYDCQEKLINHYNENRFSILMAARQSGKTESTWAYILWFVLFNNQKRAAVVANKEGRAKETLARLKKAYELLPDWLQQGVLVWNKKSIELENGSSVTAEATSENGIRGDTIALLYLDEFAMVPNNISESFWASSWPTISSDSSGTSSKVIISSTPKGYNLFWKFWSGAENGINDFKPFRIHWNDVPWRTEKWLLEQKKALGEVKFNAEVLCQFEGSTATLISNDLLKLQSYTNPLKIINENLNIYEEPIKDHAYITIIDTARGTGNDYSACITIDVSITPYKVVAVYRDDLISPYAFPEIIYQIGNNYNDSYLLLESNDAGSEVANILYHDYEYTNMFFSEPSANVKKRTDKVLGFTGKIPGVRTTHKVKILGCTILKSLMEDVHLIVNDKDIISEFSTFVKQGKSYAADSGYNDDLVMCLVLFSWLTQQAIFKNLTNIDTRKLLFNNQINSINNGLIGFGVNNGVINTFITTTKKDQEPLTLDRLLENNFSEQETEYSNGNRRY